MEQTLLIINTIEHFLDDALLQGAVRMHKGQIEKINTMAQECKTFGFDYASECLKKMSYIYNEMPEDREQLAQLYFKLSAYILILKEQ